jgi:hypothetical protein
MWYVAREVPANAACGPHTHGSWKSLIYTTDSSPKHSVWYLSFLPMYMETTRFGVRISIADRHQQDLSNSVVI